MRYRTLGGLKRHFNLKSCGGEVDSDMEMYENMGMEQQKQKKVEEVNRLAKHQAWLEKQEKLKQLVIDKPFVCKR